MLSDLRFSSNSGPNAVTLKTTSSRNMNIPMLEIDISMHDAAP